MRLNKIIQKGYTSFSLYYQIKLPLDLEISIPSDDPVRLVSAFVEEMDLSELYKTYGRIRKNQATPRQMLKLVIYAAMNRIYSSRDIRKACKRDINFMYLLEGMPAPDHATIARFISLHFSACAKVLLAQMSDLLYLLGEISEKTIFIDGTKMESAANKYTFVWKRAITKNQARLYTKLTSFVAECEELYGIRTVYQDQISIHTLKRLKKQLCRVKVQEGMVFVHGIGRRKAQLLKSLEQLDQYLADGVDHMLALRGDIPLGETTTCGDFDYATDLVKFVRDTYGDKFEIAVAGSPEGHISCRSLESDIAVLKQKQDNGADYIMTQLCWDMDQFKYWLDAIRKAGVTMPVDVGVMPILDQAATINMALSRYGCVMERELSRLISRHWLFPNPFAAKDAEGKPFDVFYDKKVAEFKEEGIEYTVKQIDAYRALGVNGIHLYALNKWKDVSEIIDRSGLCTLV